MTDILTPVTINTHLLLNLFGDLQGLQGSRRAHSSTQVERDATAHQRLCVCVCLCVCACLCVRKCM